jgi:hypothetical protein
MLSAALKAYRQRLGGVRAELVAIAEELAPIAGKPDETLAAHVRETREGLATLAIAVRGICGILVRVIDSIGG